MNSIEHSSFSKKIGYWWHQLTHLGVKPGMPFFEQQKVHLMNVLLLPGLPLVFYFTLVNMNVRPGLALLNFTTLISYIVLLYINVTHKSVAWRTFFVYVSVAAFFAEAWLYSNGMEYAMLLIVTGGIIFVEKNRHYYLFAFPIVLAFLFLKYRQFLQAENADPFFLRVIFNIFFSLFLFVFLLQYFRNIYMNYHRQVQDTKVLLEKQQQQLLQQKQELEDKNNLLQIVSDSRKRILFTLAHDLRNPLSGIEALSKRMMTMEGNTADMHSLLAVIDATAERSQKQIQQLLNANQYLETGEGSFEAESVNLTQLLTEIVQPFRFQAAQKNINIVLQVSAAHLFIQADKLQLSRVVENLLANAVKFSYPQSGILVSLATTGDQALLSVADEGIGIPEEKRPFIFDGLSVVRQTGTMGEKSFGMGLSICKQIVEAHGGSINLDMSKQKGCRFVIELPLSKAG